jgi:flavin reductase (DIM6/NTAB) family NADH-FMN oxidoreductase RutF
VPLFGSKAEAARRALGLALFCLRFSPFPAGAARSRTNPTFGPFSARFRLFMPPIDSQSFRQLMGCFATGVTAVTLTDPRLGNVGITINSLTSVSLAPPLVLFCLDKKAHLYPAFRRAGFFAVNILSADQEDVSRHFANYKLYPEPKNMWDRPQEGCPILKGTLGWMVCRKAAAYRGGDHDIFLGEAIALHVRKGKNNPLLYVHGRYRKIKK